jgi:hypothetical protein
MTDHRGARAPSFIRTAFRSLVKETRNYYNTSEPECKPFHAPAMPCSREASGRPSPQAKVEKVAFADICYTGRRIAGALSARRPPG